MADDRNPEPADARWMRMVDECAGRPPTTAKHPRAARAAPRSPAVATLQGPPSERDVLRALLPVVAQHLRGRRVDLIPPRDIAQYLALEWIEWHGGSLRLTAVGLNVCEQVALQRET